MTNPPEPPQQRVNVELPNDLHATYANFAIISHSPTEVVIDFAQLLPGTPKARVQARILLTPTNAKLLLRALADNLAKYERRFGEITIGGRQTGFFDPKTGTLGGLHWALGNEDEGDGEDKPS